MLQFPDGARIMATAHARAQRGRSNGGVAVQAKGVGHHFTSETGRKAALAYWKRHPKGPSGMRKGQRLVRRPPVDHRALRERYALKPFLGIQYAPALRVWVINDEFGTRTISERTALRKLGHLPMSYRKDRVPPKETAL